MKGRKPTAKNLAAGIQVYQTVRLDDDGWQLLSYDTEPGTGFLFRDTNTKSKRLEILYWQECERQDEAQLVIEAESGNVGIGALNPTDKLTIRGGGLSFQQAGKTAEMGIDYDAAKGLWIKARTGKAKDVDKEVLTIKPDGAITATGKFNATGGLAVTGSLSAGSITAESLTSKTVAADTEVSVGSTKMTAGTVSAQKLTASQEITVGTTKLATASVSAQKLTASAEVSVGNTTLTTEGVSGKTLSATDEIKASNVQGTGTGGSLTLSGGQGALFLRGKTVTIGSESSEIFAMNDLMMGDNKKILLKGTDDNHGIRYGGGVQFAEQLVDGPVIFGWAGGALGIRDRDKANNKEMIALVWTQEGKIGIGVTKPEGRLEIKGTAANTIIKFGGKNGDVHHLSSARDMVFNSVDGAFAFRKLTNFNDLNTHEPDLIHIGPTGDLTVKGDVKSKGKVLKSSSRELKENISALTVDEALATLQALHPIKYDYRGAHAFRQNLGFIAEEMPANLASEDRKYISPFEVIPVLTRVAQAQQRTIAALQATIRALQTAVQQSDIAPLKG